MADRDWEKELAKIDKQISSIPDEPAPNKLPATRAPERASAKASPAAVADAPTESRRDHRATLGVALRLTLSLALGVAILFWPYEARCGLGLSMYLAAVTVVAGSGIWSSVWTWRHRAGRAHTVAILLVIWGLVLGSLDVLPRIGYGKPDARHPATWTCPKG